MAASAVTPTGVRDGDPDALAGLCAVRGPAVLAYCEVVAGRGSTGAAAAADAFGSFRAAVVATADLDTLNPEAMLICATRHAAARYAGSDLPDPCARVPSLLAARADRTITLADNDLLEQHLAGCWTCRAPVARFEAADRAYLEPPGGPIDPATAAAIVAAMTAAAPVRGNAVEEPALPPAAALGTYAETPSANGHGAHAGGQDQDAQAAAPSPLPHDDAPLDQPTSAYELPAGDVASADPPPSRRASRRRGRSAPGASVLGTFGLGSRRAQSAPAADSEPQSPAPARAQRARRSIRAGAATAATGAAATAATGAAATAATGAAATAAAGAATPRPAAGTSLPRPRRAAAAGGAGGRRGRGALRLAVVLPIVLVIFAILAGLAIAGVFGGGEPASTPQSRAPSTIEPEATSTTPIVVVPGAGAASAAEVERAKARARDARRRASAAKQTPSTAGKAPPAAAATTPPATNAGATAPPPPPPPPPPAATKAKPTGKGSAGAPQVDAGSGATGAEQVPAPDTSTVPELAPPVESLDPPG